MPELPDIAVYLEALEARILGQVLQKILLADMFVLRTAVPPIDSLLGQRVTGMRRIGKRIALGFERGEWLVIHLMVAGRLQWADGSHKPKATNVLATFVFGSGSLALTEASTKRRASLHVVANEAGLALLDPGGLEVFACTLAQFRDRLTATNHTLKRALTDPHLFSGIGNAYSDEILHTAKLSPFAPASMSPDQVSRLYTAMQQELRSAIARADGLAASELKQEKKTNLKVHGRTGEPCPVCGDTVRQVIYSDSTFQYCPTCQTGGKPLSDRVLSRLLK